MKITGDDIRDYLEWQNNHNRFGEPFSFPSGHPFGRLERAIDDFMFQLEQVPPLSWAQSLVGCVNTILKGKDNH